MAEHMTEQKRGVVRRAQSLAHAGRGLLLFLKTTPNAWIHIIALIIVVFLGIYFEISGTEWMMLVFAAGLVFVAEAINTAIEIDINLTSPTYHPYARDTKDVAAGAVLIAAITAAVIGVCIFARDILGTFSM